eukprot:1516781-Amphidinium_carterae.1
MSSKGEQAWKGGWTDQGNQSWSKGTWADWGNANTASCKGSKSRDPDREFMLTHVKMDSLEELPEYYTPDWEIVLAAVKRDGRELQFAAD